jgi:hypothetical protein
MMGWELKVLTSKAEPQMFAIVEDKQEFGEDRRKLKV